MIKTLRDFREALDKMMEERGYKKSGHVQADTGADDILVSSPAAPDKGGCNLHRSNLHSTGSGDKGGGRIE